MREFMKQYLDMAMEMIIVFCQEGRVVFLNAKAKENLGYESVETGDVGTESTQTQVLISDVFPDFFTVKDGRMSTEKEITEIAGEHMAYRKNRTCFAVDMKINRMLSDENEYMCTAIDVSKATYLERQANIADEQVENAELMKTQFVANVTHELRTPVNGILGNVQAMLRVEEDPGKLATLHLMERGCRDMHSIINNILDFSKLNAGKLELEQKEFVFRELMDYIKSNHINKIAEKGLNFFMNISPEIPEKVIGDELRIGQILNNFLSNATKFTSTGKITVEVVKTAQMGDRVELFFMVIDTGIGIDKAGQDKLFKSFSQVEASTTRKYGGTGLGLNISKQLVEMMGGNVHVESEKNKGSMFSFHIWVKIPVEEGKELDKQLHSYRVEVPTITDFDDQGMVYQFGSKENLEEIKKKMSKLILCVEMENWEKAENFMDAIKQLTAEAPQPVKSSVLRLKMSVQKADYEKIQVAFDALKQCIESEGE